MKFRTHGVKNITREEPDVERILSYVIMFIDFNGFPGIFQAVSYYNSTQIEPTAEDPAIQWKQLNLTYREMERPRSLNSTEFEHI
jgi:hypothetical protein